MPANSSESFEMMRPRAHSATRCILPHFLLHSHQNSHPKHCHIMCFFYKTWQSERPQEREMRRIKNLIKIMTLKKTCDFLKLIWRRKFALEVCCSGAGHPRWPLQLVRPCPSERGSGFVEFSLSVFLWFCSQKQKQGEQVWYKHVSTCINSVFLDVYQHVGNQDVARDKKVCFFVVTWIAVLASHPRIPNLALHARSQNQKQENEKKQKENAFFESKIVFSKYISRYFKIYHVWKKCWTMLGSSSWKSWKVGNDSASTSNGITRWIQSQTWFALHPKFWSKWTNQPLLWSKWTFRLFSMCKTSSLCFVGKT